MVIDPSNLTNSLFSAGTLLLALLLILAAVLHINNLNRVHKLMAVLQHKNEVSKELLYREMTVSQGSNFTALALASWIMLFVAVAYLYLLVPTILPFSYMNIAELASCNFGFAIFGILVACLAAAIILFLDKLPEDHRELKLTELYSFYSISKAVKKMIGVTVIALCISVLLSAYIGTIYPNHSLPAELLSLMLLIGSAGILVMPIYKEAWEARR
ncbi:MAG: hypothetical protein E4G89_00840 [Methanothrix sp.]|nr:MAG: hypothetical protein E4G89_00840 [Methanothrix sp.]